MAAAPWPEFPRNQWQLAHDPKAAEETLITSLKASPDFAPSIELLRQIAEAKRSWAVI